VDANMRDPAGGFPPEAPRDFTGNASGSRTQNPLMDLFEAPIALSDATKSADALEGARGIGDFVVCPLLHGMPDGGAYVPEMYDAQWTPLPQDGGCFNTAYADGKVVREKGYWQQSECLRTLMRYAALDGKPEMRRRYAQTLALVRDEFIDSKNGGWFWMPKTDCAHHGCADNQPDACHMTAMHREALDLAARDTSKR
jgi:cellobiose epimerase